MTFSRYPGPLNACPGYRWKLHALLLTPLLLIIIFIMLTHGVWGEEVRLYYLAARQALPSLVQPVQLFTDMAAPFLYFLPSFIAADMPQRFYPRFTACRDFPLFPACFLLSPICRNALARALLFVASFLSPFRFLSPLYAKVRSFALRFVPPLIIDKRAADKGFCVLDKVLRRISK